MEWEKIGKFLNENIGIISCAVTLFGLYLNNRNLKKNFQNDFNKLHREKFLNEMSGLSFELIDVMQVIHETASDNELMPKAVDKFKKMENKVIAFGSAKAINICCYAQQNMYNGGDSIKTIAALSLLVCQLKYDLSGEIISYEAWLKIRINDYYTSGMREDIYKYSKEIIDSLKLNKYFLSRIPD